MEHSWQPSIWNDPASYQDHLQMPDNMISYVDAKEYPKEYSRNSSQAQNRMSPEYSKCYQNNCCGARKSKPVIESKEECADISRYLNSQNDLCSKENEYGCRKHFPASPSYSPTFSQYKRHEDRPERQAQDRNMRPLQRHAPRVKMFDRGRLENDYRKVHVEASKSRTANQPPQELPPLRSSTPPLNNHHSHSHHHHHPQPRSKLPLPLRPSNDGCCTSCVLCRMPNNYYNPCCLCELPVCENCLKTDRNITNWRSRITCFMSKPHEMSQKVQSRQHVYHDDDSDCSSCGSYKHHKHYYKSESPVYPKPCSEKPHYHRYGSDSSHSIYKNHRYPRRRRSPTRRSPHKI